MIIPAGITEVHSVCDNVLMTTHAHHPHYDIPAQLIYLTS